MKPGKRFFAVAAAVVLAGAFGGSAAEASSAVPAWSIHTFPAPTTFTPGDNSGFDTYYVFFANSGSGVTNHNGPGGEIVISFSLPEETTVKSIELKPPLWVSVSGPSGTPTAIGADACETTTSGAVSTVTCRIDDALRPGSEPAKLYPGNEIMLAVHVAVPNCPGLSESCMVAGSLEVSGGGAAPAAETVENEISNSPAAPGLDEFHAETTEGDGSLATEADSRPYQYTTTFALDTEATPPDVEAPVIPVEGGVRELEVALPPGLIGNPTAVPRCSHQQFNTGHVVSSPKGPNVIVNECSNDSVVGLIAPQQLEGEGRAEVLPVYNLVPPPGMPAQLGFQIFGLPVYINTRLRSSSDFGVTAYLKNTPEAERISAGRVTIWGTPGDPAHDPMRGPCSELGGTCPPETTLGTFLRLPSSCQEPMVTSMSFERWLHPGFLTRAFEGPTPVECEKPDFSPSFEARPTVTTADSPTGLNFRLHLPQSEHEGAEEPGEADLRDATVTLPAGLVVNPASAGGLASCSAGQVGLTTAVGITPPHFNEAPAACPDASKVGRVEAVTPLLDHPIQGSVFLADQGTNPFDSLLALYLVLEDPVSGVVIKLAGRVAPDPNNGRLTTTFEENPQLPIEDLELKFFEGPRAALRTPSACGSYDVHAEFVPWTAPEGTAVSDTDSFQISQGPGGPCPAGGLAPKLRSGLNNPEAGKYSAFSLQLSRDDGSEEFAGLSTTAPDGLLAKLAGVSYCPESAIGGLSAPGQGAIEAAAPSCPADSRVGSVTAGVGAGPNPFYTPGEIYLAGPYKGAPLSLVAVIPALAGPFDLGVVTNRITLNVDPVTAQVSAVADPLPTILAGIPLDIRDLRVKLDRPEFTLAPTSCEPSAVLAAVTGRSGVTATASDRFQVGGCKKLHFKPHLKLTLSGGTRRSSFPALRAVLTYPKGLSTNIASASVGLPHSEFLEQAHIRTICTRVQFAANQCPAGSIYGRARAISPLLDAPLEGPVYLRSSSHPLPDLVVALHGQIDVDLVGRIDSHKGGLRTTFEKVPDAPVTKFVLQMQGGVKGLVVNSQNLCGGVHRATVNLVGQNSMTLRERAKLHTRCHKPSSKKKRS